MTDCGVERPGYVAMMEISGVDRDKRYKDRGKFHVLKIEQMLTEPQAAQTLYAIYVLLFCWRLRYVFSKTMYENASETALNTTCGKELK